MLESLLHDARQALRALVRSRLFTLTAGLSLAIAIGSTTAIFSIVDAMLLKGPPGIAAPERLVNFGRSQDGGGFDTFSYATFVDYRDGATTLESLAALETAPRSLSLAGADGGEAVAGSIVTGEFFEVLQAQPALGRFFLPEENVTPGANPVVVLNHRFWTERFGADVGLVGRDIVLNGTPFTVVGIAADGFRGPFVAEPDLWAPMMTAPLLGLGNEILTGRPYNWLIGIGRLAPDATREQAQAELSTIARQLQQAYPETYDGVGVVVTPASIFPGEFQRIVGAFMGFLLALSGIVLLVAGTNVAGTLLARAAARRREIAVRLAIGASRARLVRHFVTETVILFLLGGLGGVLLARWIVAGMMALIPPLPIRLAVDPAIDYRVLAFAVGISVVAGVLVGLVPGLQSTRLPLAAELRGTGGSGRKQRLRSGLLVVQMAFSMLLLVVAALFARALGEARTIDPGFEPGGVQVASFDLRVTSLDPDGGRAFGESLLESARTIAGVEAAALTRMLPLDGGGFGLGPIEVPGRDTPDQGWGADWNIVSPAYFDVMGIPVLRGRAFNGADGAAAPDVAIINQTLAERLWPGQDPLGKTFRNDDRTLTVVGIARDAKYRSLGEAPRPFVYVPLAQRYDESLSLIVRTAPGAQVAPQIRRVVAELEPTLPILVQQTLAEYTSIGLFPQRIALWVAGGLGVVALLLALLGTYGITAYAVSQRTREIGIRIALGARRDRVLRLILRQGVLLASVGGAIGLLIALAVTRLLEGLLFGIPGSDPIALGAAVALLVSAALLASWFPARRAASVDALVALRSE